MQINTVKIKGIKLAGKAETRRKRKCDEKRY